MGTDYEAVVDELEEWIDPLMQSYKDGKSGYLMGIGDFQSRIDFLKQKHTEPYDYEVQMRQVIVIDCPRCGLERQIEDDNTLQYECDNCTAILILN